MGRKAKGAAMRATLDVSAQFGGRDAAKAVLPHFKALKGAAKSGGIASFPVPKLAFILRVDGEVNEYGLSGAGNVDVDRRGKYVSIDIGCTKNDRSNLEERIATGITAAPEFLQDCANPKLAGTDFEALAEDLAAFVDRYRDNLREPRKP